MFILAIVLLVLLVLLVLWMHLGTPRNEYLKSNITVYTGSDTSTGIDPSTYPIKVSIPGVGKQNVYPIAVHDDEYPKDKCKILKITTAKGKSFYGHVVNRCDRKDANCKNRYKNGAQYLVDLFYKNSKDYTNRGLKYDVNKGTIESTNHKVSANDLGKKHWNKWLTKNHVTQSNGYTCEDCC
jgi:hypothetical protein